MGFNSAFKGLKIHWSQLCNSEYVTWQAGTIWYCIYLLQLGFQSVAAVGRLV